MMFCESAFYAHKQTHFRIGGDKLHVVNFAIGNPLRSLVYYSRQD
jgi:hypothetical protein